jgi:hypothetical protein
VEGLNQLGEPNTVQECPNILNATSIISKNIWQKKKAMEMESMAFFIIKWTVYNKVLNKKGFSTGRTNWCWQSAQRMSMCQAGVTDLKPYEHDLLLPDGAAGVLPYLR